MLLLALGPVCLRMLLKTKLFGSKAAASRKVNQIVDSGKVRFTHPIRLEELRDGRAEVFWTNRLIKRDTLKHEAYVMEVITSLWPCEAQTGCDVDPRWNADADIKIDGSVYRLEMDMEEMTRDQVSSRIREYLPQPGAEDEHKRRGCQDNLLFVTLSAARATRLLRWATELGQLAYVTTIQQLTKDPRGKVWTGIDGRAVGIAPVNVAVNASGI